jgi:hypothetical protein
MTPDRMDSDRSPKPTQMALFGPQIPPQPGKMPLEELSELRINGILSVGQRGVISKWLGTLDFDRDSVLIGNEADVVRFYLFPQDGRWLDQDELIACVGLTGADHKDVRNTVSSGLTKIFRRERYGPNALETLRLPGFRYKKLIEAGVNVIEDVLRLDRAMVRQIFPSAYDLSSFQEELKKRGFRLNFLSAE